MHFNNYFGHIKGDMRWGGGEFITYILNNEGGSLADPNFQ